MTALCTLRLTEDVVEPCPGSGCVLWDESAGGCAIDALAPEVRTRRDLATHLLQLRVALDDLRARRQAGRTPRASGDSPWAVAGGVVSGDSPWTCPSLALRLVQ